MEDEKIRAALRPQAIRERRGWILHLLSYFLRNDTCEVADQHLQSTLRDACRIEASLPEVHADLRYLEGVGCAEIIEASEKTFGMMCASITSKGQNVDLGIESDPGIVVPR